MTRQSQARQIQLDLQGFHFVTRLLSNQSLVPRATFSCSQQHRDRLHRSSGPLPDPAAEMQRALGLAELWNRIETASMETNLKEPAAKLCSLRQNQFTFNGLSKLVTKARGGSQQQPPQYKIAMNGKTAQEKAAAALHPRRDQCEVVAEMAGQQNFDGCRNG